MTLRPLLAVFAIFAILVPGATARAQLMVFPFTESNVGVYATDGKVPDLDHKPAKKLFPNPTRSLRAQAPGVRAGATIHRVLLSRGLRIREFCYVDAGARPGSAGGSSASQKAAQARQGVHSFTLNVRGKAKSTLVVTMAGATRGNGRVKVTVDIGADDKIEFTQVASGKMVRRTFPITGGTPNPVRVTVDGSASWSSTGSSYDMTVEAWIQKPVRAACFFTRQGRPCDKVDLMGRDVPSSSSRHDITLNLSNAPGNAPAILGFGLVRVDMKLQGIGCPLVTVPVVFLPMRTDAQGLATVPIKTGTKLNLTMFLQSAIQGANGKTWISNGLRLDCADG